jgi:hypothetical protein
MMPVGYIIDPLGAALGMTYSIRINPKALKNRFRKRSCICQEIVQTETDSPKCKYLL